MTSSTPGAPGALGHRRLAARAALMLLICAPMQWALADEMDDMISSCLKTQNASDAQNAYYMEQRRATDPYLVQHSQDPVQTSGTGANGYSCYDTTKSAIDGLLQATSGIFGVNLGAIFGSSSTANGACGQVRQNIGQNFSQVRLQCPNVSIPGFPINCSGGLSSLANGMITSVATSATNAAPVATNTIVTNPYSNGYATTAATNVVPAASGGVLSNLTSQVTCFLAGNCQRAQ